MGPSATFQRAGGRFTEKTPDILPDILTYCWWLESGDHQLRLVVYPIIYKVLYISGGCLGFQNHQQYPTKRVPAGKSSTQTSFGWVPGFIIHFLHLHNATRFTFLRPKTKTIQNPFQSILTFRNFVFPWCKGKIICWKATPKVRRFRKNFQKCRFLSWLTCSNWSLGHLTSLWMIKSLY